MGHDPKVIRVDGTKEHAHECTRRPLEQELRIKIDVAAGDDHDFVWAVEGVIAPITRMTEIPWARAKACDPAPADSLVVECRVSKVFVLSPRPRGVDTTLALQRRSTPLFGISPTPTPRRGYGRGLWH